MHPRNNGAGPQMQGPAGMHSGSPSHMQRPDAHSFAVSEPQARPQLPQLLASDWVLVQTLAQQASLPPQVRPHAPQLAMLARVSTQVPVQQVWPVAQPGPVPQPHVPILHVSPAAHAGEQGTSAVHDPPMQASPVPHTLPQTPQFLVSVAVTTHEVPQQVPPAAHMPEPHRQTASTHTSSPTQAIGQGVTAHIPSTHSSPGSQRVPQPPQFAGLVRTSTHTPPQQISVPVHAGPVPHRQSPVEHTFPRGEQFAPHVPQSRRLLSRLTHAPMQHVRPPPQGSSGEHAATQAAPRHTLPMGQDIVQPIPPPSVGGTAESVVDPSTGGGSPASSPPPCAQPLRHEETNAIAASVTSERNVREWYSEKSREIKVACANPQL